MIGKYNDADVIVTIEGKEYALYKNGPLKKILTWLIFLLEQFRKGSNDHY